MSALNADRTVVVTGGNRGIGKAIVTLLASEGYRVTFVYNTDEGAAKALCLDMERLGLCVDCVRCDLGAAAEVERLAQLLTERRDPPYGLICNAGIAVDALGSLIDMERAERMFRVNFLSTVQLLKALSRPMARRRAGRIVLMSSVLAAFGTQGTSMYAASKGALESYMRSILGEVARKGVTINCIRPGLIATDMTGAHTDSMKNSVDRIPARRYGAPEDVAGVVSFLLSQQAAYVNGSCITVDGGLSSVLEW